MIQSWVYAKYSPLGPRLWPGLRCQSVETELSCDCEYGEYGVSRGVRVQSVQERERELIPGQGCHYQWFTRHLRWVLFLATYVLTELPPLINLTLLTVRADYPQEASQGLPVIAPQHPLRMLSAGAIRQWNFLLLRIWKWGKLIWSEVCISRHY